MKSTIPSQKLELMYGVSTTQHKYLTVSFNFLGLWIHRVLLQDRQQTASVYFQYLHHTPLSMAW
jgi:hypothetical protein